MPKPKTKVSPLWFMDKEEFQTIVNNCNSFAECLRHFNLRVAGGNFKQLKNILNEREINYEHFSSPKKFKMGGANALIPLDKILVEHSTYSTYWALVKGTLLSNVDMLATRAR